MIALTCREARGLIFDYLDGELDAVTARAVERHRDSCTNCPPLASALVAMLGQLRSLPPIAPDERWLGRLRRLITDLPPSSPPP